MAYQCVVPFSGYLRAGSNWDDGRRDRLVEWVDATVANNVIRSDIGDRLIETLNTRGN